MFTTAVFNASRTPFLTAHLVEDRFARVLRVSGVLRKIGDSHHGLSYFGEIELAASRRSILVRHVVD
ncbi:hypothetical protein AB4Y86_12975 [Arthrobacter sp. 2YAF22_2]|uniref:hypothetical protein n=1 Tax=Arthrobacter sp. 2YAF22_2 TaxID=3233029 RepID=UPI003F8EF786